MGVGVIVGVAVGVGVGRRRGGRTLRGNDRQRDGRRGRGRGGRQTCDDLAETAATSEKDRHPAARARSNRRFKGKSRLASGMG